MLSQTTWKLSCGRLPASAPGPERREQHGGHRADQAQPQLGSVDVEDEGVGDLVHGPDQPVQQAPVRHVEVAGVQRAPAPDLEPAPGRAAQQVEPGRENRFLLGPGQRGIEVHRLFEHDVRRGVVGTAVPVQLADHAGDVPGRRDGAQRRGQPAERVRHQQPRVVDRRGAPLDRVSREHRRGPEERVRRGRPVGGDVEQDEPVQPVGGRAEQLGHHVLPQAVVGQVAAEVRGGHDRDLGLVRERVDGRQVVADIGGRVGAAGEDELAHAVPAGRPRGAHGGPPRAPAG